MRTVSRRLEIELTSRSGDGTWTWRAAGARQPRGVVQGDLLPDTAAVGSVLKAEAEGGLDGLEITAVFAPRVRSDPDDRLELIGGGSSPLVTTTLVSKSRRHDHDDRRSPDGARPRGGDRRGRRDDDRRSGRKRSRRDDADRAGQERQDRRSRGRDGAKKDAPTGGGARDSGTRTDGRTPRSDRRGRRSGDKRGPRGSQSEDRPRSERPARPRSAGIKAKRVHRQAVLEALPENQQPLAREVLRAGVPGVRKTIERMNAKAAAANLPQINSEPILALAEQLAPVLKAAEWHDRADAALAGIAKIDLRDIRSVIAAADRGARTEETRALAESLRAGLAQRLEVDQRQWLDELARTIGEGRTIRALRLSSRPPKAGTPLPPDMAERLAGLAAADLNPNTNQQRWSTVVDSVALSPVRTHVIPSGAPDKPSDDLLTTIRRLADRVPQIAALFGVEPQTPSRRIRRPPPPPAPATGEQADGSDTPAQPTDTEAATDTSEQPTDTATATDTPEQPTDTEAATDTSEQPTDIETAGTGTAEAS